MHPSGLMTPAGRRHPAGRTRQPGLSALAIEKTAEEAGLGGDGTGLDRKGLRAWQGRRGCRRGLLEDLGVVEVDLERLELLALERGFGQEAIEARLGPRAEQVGREERRGLGRELVALAGVRGRRRPELLGEDAREVGVEIDVQKRGRRDGTRHGGSPVARRRRACRARRRALALELELERRCVRSEAPLLLLQRRAFFGRVRTDLARRLRPRRGLGQRRRQEIRVELAGDVDADLTDADLTDAGLTDAGLTDADLTDAGLAGADLTDGVARITRRARTPPRAAPCLEAIGDTRLEALRERGERGVDFGERHARLGCKRNARSQLVGGDPERVERGVDLGEAFGRGHAGRSSQGRTPT
ncbi:MAG: pentapeptide repeat-containing protein [Deltaproteobacteria bacterium]